MPTAAGPISKTPGIKFSSDVRTLAFRLSTTQLRNVYDQLTRGRDLLRGGGGGRGTLYGFTCGSKDNDGSNCRAEINVRSLVTCSEELRMAREVDRGLVFCTSKDRVLAL